MKAQLAVVSKPFDGARRALESLATRLGGPESHGMTHGAVEALIEHDGREILRQLLQDHITLRSGGFRGEPVVGADGIERAHRRLGVRSLMSIFGEVEVERTGCHSPGCSTLFPLDAELNLPTCSYSHGVERRLAALAGRMSFEAAVAEIATTTGARLPKRQAEEIATRWSVDFDDYYAERVRTEQDFATGDLLVLTTDGKGIVMRLEDLREPTRRAAETREHKLRRRLSKGEKRNAKRMASVASVYTLDAVSRTPEDVMGELDGARPGEAAKARPRPQGKRVWASISKSMEAVIDDLFAEASRRDPERRKKWVAVVDGNKTQLRLLRKAAKAYGVTLVIVLDVIHVLEYLWKAARALHPETSPECETWVDERFLKVLQGKASAVAASMRRSATRRGLDPTARKPIDSCAGYLVKYRDQLRYDEYLAAGLPIASGVIEGACRHLVKDRMDITGARWSIQGAEAVLRLRSLLASRDFDDYAVFHEQREKASNHDIHYAGLTPPAPSTPARGTRTAPNLRLAR